MLTSSARSCRIFLTLGLLVALAAAAPIKEKGAVPDIDLWYIPADAQAVYAIRIGDMLKTEAAKEILKNFPPQATDELKKWEEQFGMPLSEVERVTFATPISRRTLCSP